MLGRRCRCENEETGLAQTAGGALLLAAGGTAMLRLRSCPLTHLLSSPAPNPSFVVEEYLVDTCGLTPAQALKASTKLSHFKSPAKPDAALAFLAGLGLYSADVAAVVARDPLFLCARAEKTLASNVAGLTGIGLSSSEVARVVSASPAGFRTAYVVSQMHYCLSIFGSYENVLRALKFNTGRTSSLERVVKPNVSFLLECGLSVCDIAVLRLLTNKPERVRAIVACAKGLGVPCSSPMFRHALHGVASDSEETVAAKLEFLKKMFRWSDAEVAIAVSRAPSLLRNNKDLLQAKYDLLISDVELEPAYIAHRPALLTYSLEGRLRPRHYVLKFLKENGLLERKRSYYSAVLVAEKVFMENFICLTRKLHRTSLKTMWPLAEGKCQLISDLHEPIIVSGTWASHSCFGVRCLTGVGCLL